MTEAEILDALEKRYVWDDFTQEWVFFRKLRTTPGHGWFTEGPRIMDAWAMNCYPAIMEMLAFEVKTARGDFLHELKNPRKRDPAMRFSNRFYFVMPEIADVQEIPEDCGFILYKNGKLRCIKQAPKRECENPPWTFVASIARRSFQDGEGL